MISTMREYFRGLKFVLLIVVVAFIATSVVYFGTGSVSNGGSSRPNVVGTVNGEEIPAERYRRAHASIMQAYEQMTRQRMTPELAERMGIGQQVVNDLVVDAVVVQAAAKEGIGVTDIELRARIQEMREFQEDGRFSRDRYLRVLRASRVDPGDFEAEMRRQLVRRKMESLVRGGIKVSEAEVREAYERANERVRAAYASTDAGPLVATITVPDADLEPYVKANQARFTRAERRRVQYIVVSSKGLGKPVTDQDAEAYYNEHAAEFEQPRRVRVAHVLVRVPPVGGSEAENRAKARVDDVIKRAKAGEDFAKLAREVSEDTANAQQGGDLGLVGTGELVPQFEQVAFALGKGELSPEPVRTPFGYHAIKVMDIREGGKTPFKDAAAQIKEKLAAERSDQAARARAAEVRPALQAAADFGAEAKKLGLEPRESSLGRGENVEGVGRDREFEEAAFTMGAGGVSPPIKTPAGYAVLRVVQLLPAGVPPLPEIRNHVIDVIKRERAEAQATERARALRRGGQGRGLRRRRPGRRVQHRRARALLALGAAQGARHPRRRVPGGLADRGGRGVRAGAGGPVGLRGEDPGAPACGPGGVRGQACRAREAGARAEEEPGVGPVGARAAGRREGRHNEPAPGVVAIGRR